MVSTYTEKAMETATKWMQETGAKQIQDAKDQALMFAKDGEEYVKKGQSEKELLELIQVPTAKFHKSGLKSAINAVKPMMADIGGLVAEKANELDLSVPFREITALKLRRNMSQLIQECVMSKLTVAVYPEIEKRLRDVADEANLVGPVMKKVRRFVYEMVEEILRAQVYDNVATAFGKLEVSLRVPGCSVLVEKIVKRAEAEDEFGWLIKDGGWKAERARRLSEGIGAGSPLEAVSTLLDEMKETLLGYTGEAGATIEIFVSTTWAAQQEWMEAEGNELIETARGNLEDAETALANVGVPIGNFLSAGLAAALENLRETLIQIGGSLAQVAGEIGDLAAENVHGLLRTLDQMVQHLVMDKINQFVFPELEARFADLDMGNVPGPLVKKAQNAMFDMAESIVRKAMHSQMMESFEDLKDEIEVPGCKVLFDALDPKDEVDAVGWLKREGGYPKWKGGGGIGAGLMDMVKEIIDPSIIAQLEKLSGEAAPIMKKYTTAVDSALKEWQKNGAVAVQAVSDAVSDGADGAKETMADAADTTSNALEDATDLATDVTDLAADATLGAGQLPAAPSNLVPVGLLQRTGLKAAITELRPILGAISESVAKRAEEIQLAADAHSTCCRRCLDQLLQELVMSQARELVWPKLTKLIEADSRLRGPIKKKVAALVEDMAEGITRKQMHKVTCEGFKEMGKKIVQPGLQAAQELGEELEEDEYGFLVSEGGYKAFKGAAASLLDPKKYVSEVLDEDMMAKINAQLEPATELLTTCDAQAREMSNKWLNEEGGQKLLNKAGDDEKKLEKIEVPIAEFQKAGLAAAVEMLKPKLEAMGGTVAARVKEIGFTVEQRSTDMRRGLSQLIQELVVAKVKEVAFPALQEKLYEVPLPKIPGSGKLQAQLATLVFNQAEGGVREQVHDQVLATFDKIATTMTPPGCSVAKEFGVEATEDIYGFLK
eukprot:COSAG05_NODE_114_length_18068_cov_60.696422_4_plen_948_part_00